MEKAQEEGTVVPVREQSNEDLLEDRMKCIVAEIEIEKEQIAKKKRTQPNDRFPISNKEPTREHLMLREIHDAAAKWETEMRVKYMEGQVAEIVGRIMENVNNNTEFPSEPYHNWTKELMDHAKTGWYKYKKLMETVKKYPMQNLEQVCHDGEWILYDRSGASKRTKKKIEA